MGRPKERHDTYRFSLYLDGDLKDYIKLASWKQQKTITQYMNDMIRSEMDEYIRNGGVIKPEPRKMTLHEIEEILGYEIKIV